MAEHINKYETIFIVDKDKTEDETNEIVEKFKSLIASSGEVASVDVWGKRRLAYPINDKNEGFYVLVNFTASPEFPKELDRIYGITDGIIRSIIVRKDED
ncbi:MAG: 30S ribosomal protein S6 [Clostridiales bacterium]|jgi:small subunit ribosomal protein S6|nr:30S ribosomal protein S6 [Clostridiales bacterium]